jgi:serine/threonine-protein kinase
LEKLSADRFASAQEFAKALGDPGFRYGDGGVADVGAGRGQWTPLAMGLGVIAVVTSVGFGWTLLRPAPQPPVARFESPFRAGQLPIGPFELTRDGSAMVYVGPGESAGGSQLWIRRWEDLDARPIPGTEGAAVRVNPGQVALSPDGREVAFVVGNPGPLRVVPLAGGPSRTLTESAYDVAWSQDEWIYFMRAADLGISRVRPTGGEAEILTELSEGETVHGFPRPLFDGRTLLFQVWRAADGSDAEVWSLDLETGERTMLILGNNPRYAASGHLLFGTAGGRLMAAPFDRERAELTGAAIPVVEGVGNESGGGNVVYSVSEGGTLAYWAGEAGLSGRYEFVWVTRSGEATPVDAGERFVLSSSNPGWRLSPDGSRIAFGRDVDGNDDIWIKTLPDGPVSRLTFSEEMDLGPQWAPDGQSVTYRNGPDGGGRLFSMRADGTGEPELVFDGLNVAKGVWSPDGDWLVVRRAGVVGDETARDILAIRPGVDSVAVPLVATAGFWEQAPAISRDGRWLAYSSNETGRHEIFVRPFPDVNAGKWQVGGGIQPVWAHNGRELFFADPETRELKAAEFTATATTFQRARLTTLFEMPRGFAALSNGNWDFYDVALDDERFLMARQYVSEDAFTSLTLVLNFFEELKRLVPN